MELTSHDCDPWSRRRRDRRGQWHRPGAGAGACGARLRSGAGRSRRGRTAGGRRRDRQTHSPRKSPCTASTSASPNEIEAFAQAAVAAHPGLNIVINNAGVALLGQFTEIDQAQMEWLININFWGVVRTTRAFLPHLARQSEAHIVNLSSIFGIIAPPGQTAYAAAKFAVRGFSESLRHELAMAASPVKLSVVHPGGVATNIARNSRTGVGMTDNARRAQSIERFDAVAKTTPTAAALRIIEGIEKNAAAHPDRQRRPLHGPAAALSPRHLLVGAGAADREDDEGGEVGNEVCCCRPHGPLRCRPRRTPAPIRCVAGCEDAFRRHSRNDFALSVSALTGGSPGRSREYRSTHFRDLAACRARGFVSSTSRPPSEGRRESRVRDAPAVSPWCKT